MILQINHWKYNNGCLSSWENGNVFHCTVLEKQLIVQVHVCVAHPISLLCLSHLQLCRTVSTIAAIVIHLGEGVIGYTMLSMIYFRIISIFSVHHTFHINIENLVLYTEAGHNFDRLCYVSRSVRLILQPWHLKSPSPWVWDTVSPFISDILNDIFRRLAYGLPVSH